MGSLLRAVMDTSDDRIPMLARLALGIVILPHGAQDLFAWFGGQGIDGALGYYASLGVPPFLGWLALLSQFFGGLALIIGFLGRVAAFAITLVLLAAVVRLHWSVGFFMNWDGTLKGEGFEFHILAVTLAVIVIIRGSGSLSIDRAVTARPAAPEAAD